MRKIIFIPLFFCYLSTMAQSKSIDMSAMDHLWKIIDKLEKDINPSEKEWKALFETSGYKALGDWNNEKTREKFELVFSPSRKEKLDALMQRGYYWVNRDLNHLLKVKEKREAIIQYQTNIDLDAIISAALKKAEVYLPKGLTKKSPFPPISFVLFSPDARVNNGIIIYDILYAMNEGLENLVLTIAHEAHHHYALSAKRFKFTDEQSSYDPIVSTLSLLRLEGIADLIDKPYPLVITNNDTANYLIKYNAQKAQSSKMKTLDSMLCKMSDDTTGMFKMGNQAFTMFPGNCHPNGQYMAVLIKKNLGTEVLKASSVNPFLFFRQYREACLKEKTEYVISEKAMQFINRLEKMFAITK